MRSSKGLGIALSAALVLGILCAPGLAGEPEAPAKEKEKPAADPKPYEVIKYINPFSPEPPKKPAPPKPKVKKEDPKPVEKVKVLPENLHFVGVTWDDKTKSYAAMIEKGESETLFLKSGAKVGAWEVVRVDMKGLAVKGKEAGTREIEVGTRFHDGVTEEWRVKGGSASAPSGTSAREDSGSKSPSSSGSKVPKLTDTRRQKIIEELRKRREAAKRAAEKGD
jgi:hypothetical protein